MSSELSALSRSVSWPVAEPLARRLPSAWTGLVMLMMLLTALSIVYVKDNHRQRSIALQKQQRQHQALMKDHNQLLLELGAWSSPVRVQQVAGQTLKMHMPTQRQWVRQDLDGQQR